MTSKLRSAVGRVEKKVKRTKFTCLQENCTNKSIESHSQQRGGQLSEICSDGNVYTLNRSFYDVIVNKPTAFKLIPKPIKNASIYPGFCKQHDDSVFSPIEKEILKENDSLQASTFFLRTITYEITQKRKTRLWTSEFLKECSDILPNNIKQQYADQLKGKDKFIEIDLPYYLKAANFSKKNPEENRIISMWIIVNKNLLASSCTVFSPIRDFKEKMMNNIWGKPQVMFTFNLVPHQGKTHVIVSWLKEHDIHSAWIKKAMTCNLESFINYVAICESEDICIGPDLWQKTDIFTREKIHNSMRHEVHRGPLNEIPRLIKL